MKKQWMNKLIRVWRYQCGNQNPYIEEEQTTQWTKEKVQKDTQRSTIHGENSSMHYRRLRQNQIKFTLVLYLKNKTL